MQSICLKNLNHSVVNYFSQKRVRRVLTIMLTLGLVCLITHSFAADVPTDLLAGTEKSLLMTIEGTGKKYMYMAEGIVAIVSYIASKNILVFFGIIVISIFFNVFLKFAV